jgi:glycosyltransferase involved in cell wall biosynthesis
MGTKKRILINATCDIRKPSGLSIFTREITANLIMLNPDLFDVICTNDFIPDYKSKRLTSKYLSPDYGIAGNFLRWTWDQTFLVYEYKRHDYDLLFSTVQEAPVLIKNKAIVIHDILPIRFPEIFPRMKYYFYYVLPIILKTSRFIFFNSKSTQKEVFDYYNLENIPYSIIYHGYDQKLFFPIGKGYIRKKYGIEKYYCYVGDMRPYKNLTNAIIAFKKANLNDIYFLIAGKKDHKFYPELKILTDNLNVSDKVIFLDYIPREEVPHLYRNAIGLFFPSRYEGFGLPPIEAMAVGTPVITTKMTSLPEVCADAALYIDPDNTEEMAQALIKLSEDLSMRECLSQLSLARSKKFNWVKTTREHLDILISLINEQNIK